MTESKRAVVTSFITSTLADDIMQDETVKEALFNDYREHGGSLVDYKIERDVSFNDDTIALLKSTWDVDAAWIEFWNEHYL